MYGKLVHRPPFGHHCHAPRPPFGDPREVGERYLGHPELTDYWIKPYLLEALKHYPRLDDSCVVEGLWTFANSILLKNYKAAKRVPPTFDDPEVTHKIAFLDKDDVELGAIKFWRKVDSTFGIDIKLGNAGISIVGDNDNPSVSLVNTPVNDGPKEIVNVEYLNQALVPLKDALNALADRVETLEDLYENQIKPIVTDPNGNIRDVHTTIHANASDANLPTCGAVYQYGKGISDALNQRIDNLPPVVDNVQDGNMNPVTSNAVADALANINDTLNILGSSISSSDGTILGGYVLPSSHDAAGTYKGIVGTEYDVAELYQQTQGGYTSRNNVFQAYPPGTKFECIIESTVIKGDGDYAWESVSNGAFKLKSLGSSGPGGYSGGGSGGHESAFLYYERGTAYLSGTAVNADSVTLGRSYNGRVTDTVSGTWTQRSEAVQVGGAYNTTWKAHFVKSS